MTKRNIFVPQHHQNLLKTQFDVTNSWLSGFGRRAQVFHREATQAHKVLQLHTIIIIMAAAA